MSDPPGVIGLNQSNKFWRTTHPFPLVYGNELLIKTGPNLAVRGDGKAFAR